MRCFVRQESDWKNFPFWETEQRLWLEGTTFYRKSVARDCIMVFPEPAGILVGSEIFKGLEKGPRWTTIEMASRNLMPLGDVVILTYAALAVRDQQPAYRAYCSSTYECHNSQWILVHHQQTSVQRPNEK